MHILHDLRHAVRACFRRRGFAAAVILTIALGTGASTAMFSVLYAVLLKPLPQENAHRVVRLYQPNDASQTTGLSPLEIRDFREQAARHVEDIVEYHSMAFTFIGEGDARRLQTGVVSASFFDALGVRPVLGRVFQPGEDHPGAEPVLVLSHGYWQREFGGDPSVIGRTLQMNDRIHTVVGVLPPIPEYPGANDVYMPVSSCPFRSAPGWAEDRSARGLAVFALLPRGTAPETAAAELRTVASRLRAAHPESYLPDVHYDFAAVPLPELLARPARATLVMMLAATLLLFAIVCSNVGNLLIVRMLRRTDEIAVRMALGASRGRIARQLMIEAALYAVAGGAAGLVVAMAATGMLSTLVGRFSPRGAEIGVHLPVLLFSLGAAGLVTVMSGLLPLTALRSGPAAAPGASATRTTGRKSSTTARSVLVVAQIAVTFVLLTGAAALGRTLVRIQATDPGYDAEGVTTARLYLNWTRYNSPATVQGFFRELEERLRTLPGVDAAAIGSAFPLGNDGVGNVQFRVEPHVLDGPAVAALTASSGYFDALGMRVLQGRTFEPADEVADAPVVLAVTSSLARRYWPGSDAVGQRVSLDGGESWATVIAVVNDVRLGLEGEFDELVFVPHYRFGGLESRILVRSALPPAQVHRALRDVVAVIDPQQPVTDIRPLAAHRNDALSPYRLAVLLMGVFGLIAVAITAVGLGTTIAFSVAQRTREIGIRIALGATPVAVLRLLGAQTVRLAALGLGLGFAGALYAAAVLRRSSDGVIQIDAWTWLAVTILLLAVSTAAGLLPALRALSADPFSGLTDRPN